jgi:hypothetical protein
MLEWEVEVNTDKRLMPDEVKRIESHAQAFFGGEQLCYVEINHVKDNSYALKIIRK